MKLPRLTFEQSKRASAVGFDWPTNYYLCEGVAFPIPAEIVDWAEDDHIPNPENALFLQWCREVKGIQCGVSICICEDEPHRWFDGFEFRCYVPKEGQMNSVDVSVIYFDTHNQAETALIEYLLDLLEKRP